MIRSVIFLFDHNWVELVATPVVETLHKGNKLDGILENMVCTHNQIGCTGPGNKTWLPTFLWPCHIPALNLLLLCNHGKTLCIISGSTLFNLGNFSQFCSNFVRLCANFVQLCSTLFIFVQLCSTLFNFVQLCSTLFNLNQLCHLRTSFLNSVQPGTNFVLNW